MRIIQLKIRNYFEIIDLAMTEFIITYFKATNL